MLQGAAKICGIWVDLTRFVNENRFPALLVSVANQTTSLCLLLVVEASLYYVREEIHGVFQKEVGYECKAITTKNGSIKA